MTIGNESFESSDSDRFEFDAKGASGFALSLLWADTSADGWERRGFRDDGISAFKVIFFDLLDEGRDVDMDRALIDAWFGWAVEAP